MYGARNRAEHPFADGIASNFCKRLRAAKAILSIASPGRRIDSVWITIPPGTSMLRCSKVWVCLETPIFIYVDHHHFYADFTAGLRTWGVDSTRIHSEVFGPEESITPGIAPSPRLPAHFPGNSGARSSDFVHAKRADRTWDSRFQSLLELAEACDVPVKWSCRTGVCHTCECALIGGSGQVSA